MDDIVTAVPHILTSYFKDLFNSYHQKIQFTIEISVDNIINVLYLKIILSNGSLILDWFQKPTSSGRYLNFLSKHPLSHKIGTIIGLTDRAMLLSHPSFRHKNLKLIINLLIKNNYPIELIFKCINSRIHKLINTKLGNHNNIIFVSHQSTPVH